MKQPNILVICSDEHHPHVCGYMGHPIVKTPNLDRLAKMGTHFSRAYCTCPVCTPSRMSFITGKYVNEINNWFIGVPLDRGEMTWAKRLVNAGIPATMLGKMDFCGDYQDGGFSDYKIIEKRGAYEIYPRTSPLLSRLNGYVRKDKREHIIHSGIRENIVTDGTNGHDDRLGFYDHDRIVTDWACEYIREKAKIKEKSPWALYVGLLYPHWPFIVPERYFKMYDQDKIEMPVDFRIPENPNLHPEVRNFQRAQNLTDLTEKDIKRTLAAYYGMVTCMDEMVGRILKELEHGGMLDNTYIIYTSDHGENLGEHGLFYKQCSYEGSVGVPLIFAGPDIPKNIRVDRPVSLIDMYPTILDCAGLEKEQDRPGISWRDIIQKKNEDRRFIFAEYHGNFFRKDWYMLTDEQYKYTFYVDDRPSLFNVREDPHELNDLALKPEYKELLQQFEKKLRELVDPEAISLRAKKDLGLISEDGEDYTKSLTMEEAEEGYKNGRFRFEPEVPDPLE